MRKLIALVSTGLVSALVLAGSALATAPAVPDLSPNVEAYGDTLVSSLTSAAGDVLPYAAVFTAVGIGFAFIKGWIGRRKATSIAR